MLLALPPGVTPLLPIAVSATSGLLLLKELDTRERAERLAAALLETLLNAIDANDPQTGAHVRRVARFALVLAEAADLDERARHSVERIALFHDIGKISEALFDIVHDDSSLSPEKRREIATHPRRGADVLAPLGAFYPDLPEGVLAHHERWDGKGYPRSLRGEEIPLGARVVSIADTFDAIIFSRRYRRGTSTKEAARRLCEGRGTQFDPDLTDLFLLPPVFERVEDAVREAYEGPPRPRRGARRQGPPEQVAPDVNFRWRDAATAPPP
jgi:HD-GYP domain-containing protein (c-di-GMP phosphodiesterase class II)